MVRKSGDDEFELKLGRGSAKTAHRPARVFPVPSAARTTSRARAAWFNRTTGAGTVKLAHARPAGSQRVIVKTRIAVHAKLTGGGGAGGMMRHTLYVQREGAGRDGGLVEVFDKEHDRADGADFVERCEGDRHHFRVILSPENGGELASLKAYTRELMDEVSRDLGTKLDWIAAEHHDTGRPHVHLLIRGRDETGRDLVMSRHYVSHGFRERAEALATRELGPRLEIGLAPEIERRQARAVHREAPTHLDEMLRARAHDGALRAGDLRDEAQRDLMVRRLNQLERWELAERTGPDHWRLHAQLEDKLRERQAAAAREKAMARLLGRAGRESERELRAFEQAHSSQRVEGRILGIEPLSQDAKGPQLIAVEGLDGKLWTARFARLEELRLLNGLQSGAIVSLERGQAPDVKPSDRTIEAIAGVHGRVYSKAIHLTARPTDRAPYIDMHVRRLEALRMQGIVERSHDGVFTIPADYLDRVRALEGRAGMICTEIGLLDPLPVRAQALALAPTWLDHVGLGKDAHLLEGGGFAREAAQAWKERHSLLAKHGLGHFQQGRFVPQEDFQDRLRVVGRAALLARLEEETGRYVSFAQDGAKVQGLFEGRAHVGKENFAIVTQRRLAMLVPWRPEMDRALNQFVDGRINGRKFDFKFGREAELSIRRSLGLGLGH